MKIPQALIKGCYKIQKSGKNTTDSPEKHARAGMLFHMKK